MTKKYAKGVDEHGNYIFDYDKVNKDMQAVIKGEKSFTRSLYEVMSLRFTIAHYNWIGWFGYYNGNWKELADEIERTIHCGWEKDNALFELVDFLRKNDNTFV